MKLQGTLAYSILLLCNLVTLNQYSVIELLYSFFYSTTILIYLGYKKLVVFLHLLFILLVNTTALVCNHPML